MSKLLKKRVKKIGTPPGSLIYTGEISSKESKIILFIYNEFFCLEKHVKTIDEAFDLLSKESKEGITIWIHMQNISDPAVFQALGQKFKIHPLILEDIMNPVQRAKLDDYKEQLFIVTRLLTFINGEKKTLEDEQLSLVVGKNLLISFLEKDSEILNPIWERLKKSGNQMRSKSSDYLVYAILDCIVDHYFLILEKVDGFLEHLEDELLHEPGPSTINKIQKTKREMALLRKTIWPMREVINRFRHIDSPLISDSTRVFAYDVYDHTIQAIETVESFRDVTSGMIDIYLSTINQRMNEIMKVLTIMATIFVPLTFISSLYGMNFDNMPELHHPYGYYYTLFVMLMISLGMLIWFRKKKWI